MTHKPTKYYYLFNMAIPKHIG